ncbi:MAG: AI-2E family transporter [Alphaproteobacteria bacterium]|nr:AI-2E family transporter [Alphaproteobacteria bacterium]MCW5738676.1 AI-2E family transporter [Alphaproteobacteria bacterium]
MTLQRAALWTIVIAATVYLLIVGRSLLLPFVLALVLWYMVDALADAIERPPRLKIKIPRLVALTAAILAMGGLLWVLGRTITANVTAVIAAGPSYQVRLEKLINQAWSLASDEPPPSLAELVGRISIADTLADVASAVAALISVAGIVLVYTGFLFVEAGNFRRKLTLMFTDPAQEARMLSVLDRISRDIRVYIRIKTTLATLTSAAAYVLMAAVGVDFAGFWAVMMFFFYFIPTIGSILAIIAPTLLTLVQFDSLTPFLIVLFTVGPLQIIMANVVEPAMLGRSLNLSALVVIISLMVWGSIWGVVGMFLCVPIMVVMLIVLSNFESTRPVAVLLSADGRLPSEHA